MTFALAGFNTVKREGVEVSGSFTATVNAELRVGALEETVTVKARGLPSPNSVKKIWDFNPGFGGPLRKDSLWF